MTSYSKPADKLSRDELIVRYNRCVQLGSRDGFFQAYYDMLPEVKFKYQAFDRVNAEYYEHFGSYRYSHYQGFLESYKKFISK